MSDRRRPGSDDTGTVSTGRLALTWALVGVPLAYGVFETLRGTAQLFTG